MKFKMGELNLTGKGLKVKDVSLETEEKKPSQPSNDNSKVKKAWIKKMIAEIIKWFINPCNE